MEIDRTRMCYNLVTLYTHTSHNIFQQIVISTQGVYKYKIVCIDLQLRKHIFLIFVNYSSIPCGLIRLGQIELTEHSGKAKYKK